MDKKVVITGDSKRLKSEMKAAMAAMKQIVGDETIMDTPAENSGIPDKIASGLVARHETRDNSGRVHQHANVAEKEKKKYLVPVDIQEPIFFACSGDGIEKVNLYVYDNLISSVSPTDEIQTPDGQVIYMLDFLGKPLRGDLIAKNKIVVEFVSTSDNFPQLTIMCTEAPSVSLGGSIYEEPVVAHGASGPVELTIVYTPTIVGFRKKD